ncbi:hypothetical protein QR680_003743 [Steinernema hermaphroditum]|uniref:Uncharacterized protein n=1 Tax=Steinernema hermaphroditum TaxID=289476 RepID=A0AA39HNN8_9BILA|nr:hypothetical protein QR680_003743 [Steinernema hermaphroditum]
MSSQPTPPHRGFSLKAREILLDPPGAATMQEQAKLTKIDSDSDVRKLFQSGFAIFRRSDSQSTQQSGRSDSTEGAVPDLDRNP